jgi:hypothetical protein
MCLTVYQITSVWAEYVRGREGERERDGEGIADPATIA